MSAEDFLKIKQYAFWGAVWTLVVFPMIMLLAIAFRDIPSGSVAALLTYMGGLVGGPLGVWIWKRKPHESKPD